MLSTLFIFFPNDSRGDGVAADERPIGDVITEPLWIFWENIILGRWWWMVYSVIFQFFDCFNTLLFGLDPIGFLYQLNATFWT